MPDPTPCPICGKPASAEHRPFCSARCAEIDLGRWFTGQYRLPGPPAEDEDAPAPALERERGMG